MKILDLTTFIDIGLILCFLGICGILLNTRNILNVYNFTGNPSDDGYLTSAQAAQSLSLANNAASFIDMYNISINQPGNFSSPRQIRIGLMFNF